MTPTEYQAYYECDDPITGARLIADGWTEKRCPDGPIYTKKNMIIWIWRSYSGRYSLTHHGKSKLSGSVKTMGQLRHAVAAMG